MKYAILPLMAAAIALGAALPAAAQQDGQGLESQAQSQMQSPMQLQLPGAHLLTEQERLRMHERIQAAGSEQERQQIRSEYQQLVRQRAQEKGVEVPAGPGEPGAVQRGQRPGSGMRQGGQGNGGSEMMRRQGGQGRRN